MIILKKPLLQTLLAYLAWTALIYGIYCGLLYFYQRKIIFPRDIIETPSKPPDTKGYEIIALETPAGGVETFFLPSRRAAGAGERMPAVIYAHGNAELIDFCLDKADMFTRMGMAVLLVEYPGYGRSAGKPSQKTITRVFTEAYDRLAARPEVDSGRIFFFGRSLGGAVVCALAQERTPAALVLMSTFTGIRSFAVRYLVPGFLVRDPFDNLSVVKRFQKPILVLHGTADEVIPYAHGAALFAAAPHAEMVTYGCGHNDCPPDLKTLQKDIEPFLHRAGIL